MHISKSRMHNNLLRKINHDSSVAGFYPSQCAYCAKKDLCSTKTFRISIKIMNLTFLFRFIIFFWRPYFFLFKCSFSLKYKFRVVLVLRMERGASIFFKGILKYASQNANFKSNPVFVECNKLQYEKMQ